MGPVLVALQQKEYPLCQGKGGINVANNDNLGYPLFDGKLVNWAPVHKK